MARGINRVTLIGNLGRDPEVRTTQDQFVIANITLATSSAWKDRKTGQLQERTEWHRVVFFGRLGEIVRDYLKKGSKIYVEGRLQTRKWTDQQGADRYTTEIIANEMQMLDSRGGSKEGSFQAPASTQSAASPQQQPAAAPANAPSPASDTFDDDDIPF